MNENDREYVEKTSAPGWLTGIAVAGIVLALGALGWSFGLQNNLKAEQQKLDAANQQNTALSQRLDETNERMRAQAQTLGQSV
ncbi:MAG TPA: hypothetical protein VGG18_09930, partial [Granulicella sp.]